MHLLLSARPRQGCGWRLDRAQLPPPMRPARRRHRHVRLAWTRETSSNQKATPCPSLEASTRRFTAWSSDGAWPPCWVPPAGTRSAPACPAPLARRSWPRSEGEGHSTGAGHLPPARGVRGRGGMVAAAAAAGPRSRSRVQLACGALTDSGSHAVPRRAPENGACLRGSSSRLW